MRIATSNSIQNQLQAAALSIPADDVVREILRTIDEQDPGAFTRSPGFVAAALQVDYTSGTVVAASVNARDTGTWGRIDSCMQYMNKAAKRLSKGAKAVGQFVNPLIAQGNKQSDDLTRTFGQAQKQAPLFQEGDLSRVFRTAAQVKIELPLTDEQRSALPVDQHSQSAASILAAKYQEVPAPDAKILVSLLETAEHHEQTARQYGRDSEQALEFQLDDSVCIKAFADMRKDGSPFEAAPEQVRSAIAASNGQRSTHAAQ